MYLSVANYSRCEFNVGLQYLLPNRSLVRKPQQACDFYKQCTSASRLPTLAFQEVRAPVIWTDPPSPWPCWVLWGQRGRCGSSSQPWSGRTSPRGNPGSHSWSLCRKKIKLRSLVGGWGWGFVDRVFVWFYRLTFMYSHKYSPISNKCVIIFFSARSRSTCMYMYTVWTGQASRVCYTMQCVCTARELTVFWEWQTCIVQRTILNIQLPGYLFTKHNRADIYRK